MNYLDEILEFWLPTKWSRLIAGLSTTLGIISYFLSDFLNTINIQIPYHLTPLIRIATPLLIWLLGSLFVLHIVVQHAKTTKSQKQFALNPSDAHRLDRKVRMLIERMENEKKKCSDPLAKTTMHHTQEDLEEISADLRSINKNEKNNTS